jgi:hypothetical protein
MSDSEEEYDDSEEEEEEEDEEEEEGGGETQKNESVKEDIAMLMDVFGYVDRTSKRIASRLENESMQSNRGAGGGGNHTVSPMKSRGQHQFTVEGGGKLGDSDEDQPHELNGGWSQYEYMGDADRGLLLEKAILALGINENADQMNQREQYAADGNAPNADASGGRGKQRRAN